MMQQRIKNKKYVLLEGNKYKSTKKIYKKQFKDCCNCYKD